MLQQRLVQLEARIRDACRRASRDPSGVTLVLVTKYASLAHMHAAYRLGYRIFGESRVQQLADRVRHPGFVDVEWHMIGHLQSNKVRRCLETATTIHSVHSLRLARQIDGIAAAQGRRPQVYLQMNITGENRKQGFTREALRDSLDALYRLQHLRLEGLMTMAAYHADARRSRPCFAALREYLDELITSYGWPKGANRLSMGMTHDFEIAIEEGAGVIRIGSAVFGGHGHGA